MSLCEQKESAFYTALSTRWAKELLTLISEPAQVARLFELVEEQVAVFDNTANHTDTGSTVDCKKGCASCCYLPVKTLPSIARYIGEQFSGDERRILKARLASYLDGIEKSRQACPFLQENQCSIYEFRPLACRTFTSPNVKLCEKNLLTETQIPQQAFRYQLYQAATVALQVVAMKKQQAYQQVNFIQEVFDAVSYPELGLNRKN